MQPAEPVHTASESSRPENSSSSWNRAEALALIGGDNDLLQDLCNIFLEESPKLLSKLRQAVADRNFEAVQRAAHSLKGEASYLGAAAASQNARQLEQMAEQKTLDGAAEQLTILERQLDKLYCALKETAGAHR